MQHTVDNSLDEIERLISRVETRIGRAYRDGDMASVYQLQRLHEAYSAGMDTLYN